eukprot:c35839_g1_i1 orf=254-415(+)
MGTDKALLSYFCHFVKTYCGVNWSFLEYRLLLLGFLETFGALHVWGPTINFSV